MYENWEHLRWCRKNLPIAALENLPEPQRNENALELHYWDPMAIGLLHEASEAKLTGGHNSWLFQFSFFRFFGNWDIYMNNFWLK